MREVPVRTFLPTAPEPREEPVKKRRQKIVRPSAELQEIWAEIPAIPDCQRKCVNSCGPLPISDDSEELKLIEARSGKKLGSVGPHRACSMLSPTGNCTVYSVRPTICRLWGAVESLRCPHGCEPERMLTDEEGFALLARAEGDREAGDVMRDVLRRMSPSDRALLTGWLRQGEDLTPRGT